MAVGQGHPSKPSKRLSFYKLCRKNKRTLQCMMKEKRAYTISLPTNLMSSALCIFSYWFQEGKWELTAELWSVCLRG